MSHGLAAAAKFKGITNYVVTKFITIIIQMPHTLASSFTSMCVVGCPLLRFTTPSPFFVPCLPQKRPAPLKPLCPLLRRPFLYTGLYLATIARELFVPENRWSKGSCSYAAGVSATCIDVVTHGVRHANMLVLVGVSYANIVSFYALEPKHLPISFD